MNAYSIFKNSSLYLTMVQLVFGTDLVKQCKQYFLIISTNFILNTLVNTLLKHIFMRNIYQSHQILITDDVTCKQHFISTKTLCRLFDKSCNSFIWFQFHTQSKQSCLSTQMIQFLLKCLEESISILISIYPIHQL